MQGSINERQDPDGRIRRRGEMKLPYRKSLFSKLYLNTVQPKLISSPFLTKQKMSNLFF